MVKLKYRRALRKYQQAPLPTVLLVDDHDLPNPASSKLEVLRWVKARKRMDCTGLLPFPILQLPNW